MNKLVIGILAHVDAGKTTLSESLLYLCGKIQKVGRVDHKDTYLDTEALEKARGITIFLKQALFQLGDKQVTLLDTPGHVDFSIEMERILSILDYAILVISGVDGIQSHTQTLWNLLQYYAIPTFIFINKMDQDGVDKAQLIHQLKTRFNESCIAFEENTEEDLYEEIAYCDEFVMEYYLEHECIEQDHIIDLIKDRKLFPVFFGSALKLIGVENFIKNLTIYTKSPHYPKAFGAKVFKITRDEQGNRLTHMKITGGQLKVRESLSAPSLEEADIWEEKVTQIRLYSGNKFETISEVTAGDVCAVMGLSKTYSGQGLGIHKENKVSIIQPVLSYQLVLPNGYDPKLILPKLKQLEEEEPELHIVWNESLQEIQVQIMGEIQIEVLQSLIEERFNIKVRFAYGRIIYKETITNIVEGVGHFEPLKHYAEVHLLLEPSEEGSGLEFNTVCSEDLLEKNWQRLILTHLQEKLHKGVLTGSAITDMKITLVAGKAHKKHTEGGDFREATYRAVRQGLMEAESILLEPYYDFRLEIPEKMIGRAMTDIEKMKGKSELLKTENGITTLVGSAPVATMRYYQKEVYAYTKGYGQLFCQLKGYKPCHNTEEVIEQIHYDPLRDLENPSSSVFCSQGSGFIVEWNEVKNYMHIESFLSSCQRVEEQDQKKNQYVNETSIGLDEIDQIIKKTFYANQGEKSTWKKNKTARQSHYELKKPIINQLQNLEKKEHYLLVDGYNIIYTWPELNELSKENMDSARMMLLDQLCNYQGIKNCQIIVVFDAYRVPGNRNHTVQYHNIDVVYTKEAETADQYIEKFSHTHKAKYDITVATSDGLEQIIIRGQGCKLLSARELKEQIHYDHNQMMLQYQEQHKQEPNYLERYFRAEEES